MLCCVRNTFKARLKNSLFTLSEFFILDIFQQAKMEKIVISAKLVLNSTEKEEKKISF